MDEIKNCDQNGEKSRQLHFAHRSQPYVAEFVAIRRLFAKHHELVCRLTPGATKRAMTRKLSKRPSVLLLLRDFFSIALRQLNLLENWIRGLYPPLEHVNRYFYYGHRARQRRSSMDFRMLNKIDSFFCWIHACFLFFRAVNDVMPNQQHYKQFGCSSGAVNRFIHV